jgi:hypothetical protein
VAEIEALAAEQEADPRRLTERWRAEAVSTRPIDRATARAAVCALYQAYGLPAPRLVLFLSSPMACHFARALVQALMGNGDLGRGKAIERLHRKLINEAWERWPWLFHRQFGRESLSRLEAGSRIASALEDEMNVEQELLGGDPLEGPIYSRLKSQVCDLLERELMRQCSHWPEIHPPIGARLPDLLQKGIEDRPWAFSMSFDLSPRFFKGGQDATSLALYDYGARLGTISPYLAAYKAYARSCGWMYPHDKVGFLSERPMEIQLDAQGRPHCATGMAIRFRDGWGAHAWHGVRVPARIIAAKDFDVHAVDDEANVEWRRIMLERDYGGRGGFEIYLQARQARVVGEDEVHGQPRRLLEVDVGSAPIRIIEVINGSPEPDGTRRRFHLGAMPGDTPHNVVAASYGIDPAVYREALRT